jgi:predicted PhzF superfamily epimerase YddE/YHI9
MAPSTASSAHAAVHSRMMRTAPAPPTSHRASSHPGAGIPEDPVTGSAHCCLAPYFARRLGRNTLHVRQCSRRAGELAMAWAPGHAQVTLRASAVTTICGRMVLPEA